MIDRDHRQLQEASIVSMAYSRVNGCPVDEVDFVLYQHHGNRATFVLYLWNKSILCHQTVGKGQHRPGSPPIAWCDLWFYICRCTFTIRRDRKLSVYALAFSTTCDYTIKAIVTVCRQKVKAKHTRYTKYSVQNTVRNEHNY